jgi:molybdenum cofactor cytidylyltransferase
MHPVKSIDRPAAEGRDVAIAVLAAGRSTRMGSFNKLLSHFDGVPLLQSSVCKALASGGRPVIVVLGHMEDELAAVLGGLDIHRVANPLFATGMASSVQAAIASVPAACAGVMIHLADMPAVSEIHMSRMIDAFKRHGSAAVVRATASGRPGNPVILPRLLFASAATLSGDVGARKLIEASGIDVISIEIGDAALIDVDTVDTLQAAGGKPPIG